MNRRSSTLMILGLLAASGFGPLGCLVEVPVSTTATPSASPNATALDSLLLPRGRGGATNVSPNGARLSVNGSGTATMNLGESRSLATDFQLAGGLAATTGVVWTSSAESIVTVNPTSGVARALAKGTAVITASLQDDPSVKAQITLNVADAQGVTLIRLTPPSSLLLVDEKTSIQAEVVLGTGEIKSNVIWSSSDEKIATVSASGEVRGVALGTAQILASYADDPAYKGQASVRVVASKDSPTLAASATPTEASAAPSTGDEPGTVVVTNQGTWVDQTTGVTEELTYVKFFDAQNGIAAGPGVFLTSSDGGASWSRKPSAAALTAAFKFDFQDAGDGWVVTKSGIYSTSNGGSYALVTDFQATYGATLADVVRTSGDDAYAITAAGNVYQTTDGGSSWSDVSTPFSTAPAVTPSPAAYRTIQLYNMQDYTIYGPIAAAGDNLFAFKSHEYSCKNFQTNSYYTCLDRKFYARVSGGWVTSDMTGRVDNLLFTSTKEGWRGSSQGGGLERTTDGGKSWIPVSVDVNTNLPGFTGGGPIYATDTNHIWVGMGGGFISSTNDGRTWSTTSLSNFQLKSICVLDEAHAWAVGSQGKVKRYAVL